MKDNQVVIHVGRGCPAEEGFWTFDKQSGKEAAHCWAKPNLHINKVEILNQVQDDNRRGFTLIELLVVVLIIGILAAVAVPQYQRAVEKARMTEAITLLSSVAQAEKVYYLANGEYTDDFDDLDLSFEIATNANGVRYAQAQQTALLLRRAKNDHVVYTQPRSENIYWRLYYYLDEDEMYCGTKETDVKGLALCKSFGGTEPMVCGGNGELVCYEVK